MKEKKDYEISSGNVFADLGLSNPEARLAKAELARQINIIIKQQNLTQLKAAKLLKIDQSKISDLNDGALSDFSLEELFSFLNILGQSITIKVTPKSKTKKTNTSVTKSTKKVIIKPKENVRQRTSIQAKKRK